MGLGRWVNLGPTGSRWPSQASNFRRLYSQRWAGNRETTRDRSQCTLELETFQHHYLPRPGEEREGVVPGTGKQGALWHGADRQKLGASVEAGSKRNNSKRFLVLFFKLTISDDVRCYWKTRQKRELGRAVEGGQRKERITICKLNGQRRPQQEEGTKVKTWRSCIARWGFPWPLQSSHPTPLPILS